MDPATLPAVCVVSAELSAGPLVTDDPPERAVRQARLQQAEQDFAPVPFDAECARAFGQVLADLRAAGRKTTARSYDALIASTAVAHRIPLFTLNPGDFVHITRLDVRTPGSADVSENSGAPGGRVRFVAVSLAPITHVDEVALRWVGRGHSLAYTAARPRLSDGGSWRPPFGRPESDSMSSPWIGSGA